MQTVLVILIFCLAAGFLLKKFVWNPLFEARAKTSTPLDGRGVKCGKDDCGCH